MNPMPRLPAMFVAHGSPMHALADDDYARRLSLLGTSIPLPRAILCISAHWETAGGFVTRMEHPRTIHDFSGFPKELSEFEYPAPGCPALAERVHELVPSVRFEESRWGLDHGAWAVLTHLFPQASVPVVELSLDRTRSPREHLELGRALRPLREEGILILGSGNVVHNLRFFMGSLDAAAAPWATAFDEWVKGRVESRDFEALVHLPDSREAHLSLPTLEHFWPLLYVLGASFEDEFPRFDYQGIEYGAISMRCVRFGDVG